MYYFKDYEGKNEGFALIQTLLILSIRIIQRIMNPHHTIATDNLYYFSGFSLSKNTEYSYNKNAMPNICEMNKNKNNENITANGESPQKSNNSDIEFSMQEENYTKNDIV